MVNYSSSSAGIYNRDTKFKPIDSHPILFKLNVPSIRERSCVYMLSKQIYAQIRHDVWDTKCMDQQGSNGTVLENSCQTEIFENFIEEALLLCCASVNQKESFAEFWRGEMGPFGIKQMGWGTTEGKNVYLILRYNGGGGTSKGRISLEWHALTFVLCFGYSDEVVKMIMVTAQWINFREAKLAKKIYCQKFLRQIAKAVRVGIQHRVNPVLYFIDKRNLIIV